MSGTNVGSLSVYQQELGKGVSPAQLWIRSGNQGKRWQEAEVHIKGYQQYKVMNDFYCDYQWLNLPCFITDHKSSRRIRNLGQHKAH